MPEQTTKTVVVNTTPIISLSILGRLDLLQALYERPIVPPAVRRESLIKGIRFPGAPELTEASWIETVSLKDPRRADLITDLDRGEAEVIALAQEINADLVILNERLARRHAKRLGLRLTGTVGVLLRAKSMGIISEVRPMIETLQSAGIRLGRLLVQEVLRSAGEI